MKRGLGGSSTLAYAPLGPLVTSSSIGVRRARYLVPHNGLGGMARLSFSPSALPPCP